MGKNSKLHQKIMLFSILLINLLAISAVGAVDDSVEISGIDDTVDDSETIKNDIDYMNIQSIEENDDLHQIDDKISYSDDELISSDEKITPNVEFPNLNESEYDVYLPDDATGEIILFIEPDSEYYFPVEYGYAYIEMPDLNNGDYSYTITYSGDDKYYSVSENGDFTFDKINTNIIFENVKYDEDGDVYLLIESNVEQNDDEDYDDEEFDEEIDWEFNEDDDENYDEEYSTNSIVVLLKGDDGNAIKKVTLTLNINDKNYKAKTNARGIAVFRIYNLEKGMYSARVTFYGNAIYNGASQMIKVISSPLEFTTPILESEVSIGNEEFIIGVNCPSVLDGNILVLIDGNVMYNKSIYHYDEDGGNVYLTLSDLNIAKAGNYDVIIKYLNLDGVENEIVSYKLNVTDNEIIEPIIPSKIIAPTVTTVYNGDKYLTVTLKEYLGNPITNVYLITILSNGKTYASTTGKNGQIKISTNGFVPKKYTATIIFAGNDKYLKSTTTVKIIVNKATPKLTAKAKTFKKSLKIKKYSLTLKTNKNKVMKKVKVYLKVKGKTFTAKTDSKGKATFKISKLTKKGTFKAIITYKGDKYYNKLTKKVNIKCK